MNTERLRGMIKKFYLSENEMGCGFCLDQDGDHDPDCIVQETLKLADAYDKLKNES